MVPPPFFVLSSLNGSLYPSIKNSSVGNDVSTLVSFITKTSIFPDITSFNSSILYLSELILKVAKMSLPTF